MAIEDTDLLLVARGGTNYKQAASDIMAIEDTDLLLVARGGTNYKVTGEELKTYAGGAGPGSNWAPVPNLTGLPGVGANTELVYNNGVWLIPVNSTSYCTSSDDGETWTTRSWGVGGSPICGAGGGKFVVFGVNTSSACVAFSSTDGIAWSYAGTIASPIGAGWGFSAGAIGYGQGTWWAAIAGYYQYSGELGTTIYKSTNLSTWTSTGINPSYSSGGYSYNFIRPVAVAVNSLSLNVSGVIFADNQYYATSNQADITTSPVNPMVGVTGGSYVTSGLNTENFSIAGTNNIIAIQNNSSGTTTGKIFTNARGTLTTIYPNTGFNQIYCGFYNATAGAVCVAGSGGAISYTYDDGVTWTPSYKQFETSGMDLVRFTGAASSATVGMLIGYNTVTGVPVLLRSSF